MLECVVNISEGRRLDQVELIARAAAGQLLDVHTDADHHRAVLTLAGEEPATAVAATAVLTLDLSGHVGAHPRFGVVDVVPFSPLGSATIADTLGARERFARWMGDEMGVPCFCYGPERRLSEVRRDAFGPLRPDFGPAAPHPTAGATAVGARPPLVAYNLWLARPDLDRARAIARAIRGPAVRALGLAVGDEVQVSMNLVDPAAVGPAAVYDVVAEQAEVARAELVGLVPVAVLDATDRARWVQLDLAADRTIEHRLAQAGITIS